MHKIALALALALSFVGGSAHALAGGGAHIVAPKPGVLKQYLKNAKGAPVKASFAHNSQSYKVLNLKAGTFTKIQLDKAGPDSGRTAYILKQSVKGLKPGFAYIVSETIAGPEVTSKVRLPLFSTK